MRKLVCAFLIAVGFVVGVGAPASADVNDFVFDSFDATYTLSVDDEGRSVLDVSETLVAEFPASDQNRGIRRMLVERYKDAPVDLQLFSVTDEKGQARSYETESDDGFLAVTIRADDYLHGQHTYVISYRMHNVTRYFSNTDSDEFYWDTNGTDWAQPFRAVTARVVVVDESLRDRLTGNVAATSGRHGETGDATITRTDDGYQFSAENLPVGGNLTFAIGFEPHTFVPRDNSFFASPFPLLASIGGLGSVGSLIAAWGVRRKFLMDAPGRGTIIPQYTPPPGANVFQSAEVIGKQSATTTAGILWLAVNHKARVIEDGKKKYTLELLSTDGLDRDMTKFVRAIFGKKATAGSTQSLSKPRSSAASRIGELTASVAKDARKKGYRAETPTRTLAAIRIVATVGALMGFIFAAVALSDSYAEGLMAITLFGSIGASIFAFVLVGRRPLAASGVELRDYLAGLKMYISLAEVDRLRVLQSPDGAERAPLPGGHPSPQPGGGTSLQPGGGPSFEPGGGPSFEPDGGPELSQVVRLYEKLLPYAALVGLEKQWSKQIGAYYEQSGGQPDWYVGHGMFNAALLASSVSSFTSAATSSYSSSSGGSTGGISSGGGGGGGGGGGV